MKISHHIVVGGVDEEAKQQYGKYTLTPICTKWMQIRISKSVQNDCIGSYTQAYNGK